MAGTLTEPQPPQTANGNMPSAATNGAGDNMTTTTIQSLTPDEIALYDRQIRLWGAQAQERIRSAHILLVSLRALGTEIAKNLTLAGISSLTIIDEEPVAEEDLGSQYFLREEDIGQPRAQKAIPRIQELNPRVAVKSGGSLQDLLSKDQTFYTPYDCVIACDHDFMTLCAINTAARVASRPFYAAAIHGFYGYIFADLVAHEYVVERDKSNIPTIVGVETLTRAILSVSNKRENNGKTVEIVKKQEMYCPLILANSSSLPFDVSSNRRKLRSVPALLPCLRALFDFQRANGRLPNHGSPDLAQYTALATTKARELKLPPETLRAEFLRSFLQNIGAEIVPTAAFVGGRLSEDVINVLGKREQPIQNFALFDGDSLDGKIYSLYSLPPELAMPAEINGTATISNDLGLGMQQMPDPIAQTGGLNGVQDMSANMAGMNGGMKNGAATGGLDGLQNPAVNTFDMSTTAPSMNAGSMNNAGPTSAPTDNVNLNINATMPNGTLGL